jgi:hypothetical protein
MRFARREKAILSQWEVGAGLVPGGGRIARLPRLIGRRRALEVLLGADDIRGDIAELYGYVNLSLPDADLDGFVDALATRIGSFDKQAIADTKRLANVPSLAPDAEIAPEWEALMASVGRPASQQRITRLMEQGFHKPGDAENRLDTVLGNWGAERPRCWETAAGGIRSEDPVVFASVRAHAWAFGNADTAASTGSAGCTVRQPSTSRYATIVTSGTADGMTMKVRMAWPKLKE